MDILRKKLRAGEVRWKGIVIPRDRKDLFPPPGVEFDLSDGKTMYRAKVDNQYRIRLAEWFSSNPMAKPGQVVVFSTENGIMEIRIEYDGSAKAISLRDLLGKDTNEGKIVDIQQTPKGTIAVVQSTREVPLDQILDELRAADRDHV